MAGKCSDGRGLRQTAPISKPQRRFQFIDNNNVTSMGTISTQVRRHVMQEYMREKRWEARSHLDRDLERENQPRKKGAPKRHFQKHKNGSQRRPKEKSHNPPSQVSPESATFPGEADPASPTPLDTPGHFQEVISCRKLTPDVPKRPIGSFFLGPAAFAQLAIWPKSPPFLPPFSASGRGTMFTPLPDSIKLSLINSNPAPQSLLGAARTDPFNCLPMVLSRQDQELFDFCANVMPACSYGFERRSPHAHNWYLSVFIPEAMQGAACFQNTILVHAADTQAWVKGLSKTPLAVEHRARASEFILIHFQKDPLDTSDAAISATVSAAALEELDPRPERRRYAWIHWRTVLQKVRDRGGPAALVQNNRLQMLINWFDYIFSGYNACGATFFFDHRSSPGHSNEHEAELIARQEIDQQCAEFITFLNCAEHLALAQANMQSIPLARRQQHLRYSVFQPGQPLYNLVASPNGPRYQNTGQFKHIVSRLAALMTINTAIWEYRHSAELSEAFFAELAENIQHNELDHNISMEAFIQIFLSGSKLPELQHTERPWFVGRMLKIAKRLSRPSFEKLNNVLLGFLILGPDLHPVMLEWEDELRAEVLQAPLVSYKLPLMQSLS